MARAGRCKAQAHARVSNALGHIDMTLHCFAYLDPRARTTPSCQATPLNKAFPRSLCRPSGLCLDGKTGLGAVPAKPALKP